MFRIVTKSIVIIAAVICSFSACKSEAEKPIIESSYENEADFRATIDSIAEVVYSFPDPDEIINEIFISDIKLKQGVVCSRSNAEHLYEFNSMATFMGVLMADISYLILQEKNSEALIYSRTAMRLSDKLNLNMFRDKDIMQKVENNIESKDALFVLHKEFISDIKYELEYSKRGKTLALVYTGSIIESLYLSMENINKDNIQTISPKIIEQYLLVKNLISFLGQYDSDPEVKEKIVFLSAIYELMEECVTYPEKEVQEKEDGHFRIKSSEKVEYNMQNFDLLKSKIIEFRNAIVE